MVIYIHVIRVENIGQGKKILIVHTQLSKDLYFENKKFRHLKMKRRSIARKIVMMDVCNTK